MGVRNATVSVSSTPSYVDFQEFNDGINIENQGISTVYIRISKIFSVVTQQDLPLEAGQSVYITRQFQFLAVVSAAGDTSTIRYFAFNRS